MRAFIFTQSLLSIHSAIYFPEGAEYAKVIRQKLFSCKNRTRLKEARVNKTRGLMTDQLIIIITF